MDSIVYKQIEGRLMELTIHVSDDNAEKRIRCCDFRPVTRQLPVAIVDTGTEEPLPI